MTIGSGKIGYDRPPAAAGVCQHHGAAYAELSPTLGTSYPGMKRESIANGATIVSVAITITERCCIAVSSALMVWFDIPETDFEIERPVNTIRTTQEHDLITYEIHILHHAAWEVLDPGTYTYYLVNRAGSARNMYGAWIKAVASDCLG